MLSTIKKMSTPQDPRGMRGILSRGYAKYGVSNAPKPGKIGGFDLQRAAQNRIKKVQGGYR